MPLVFVTVGTDHHPFDRLISWVDDWLAGSGRGRARVLVQAGASAPSMRAETRDFLPRRELARVLASSAVVVCHGGPGAIMEGRSAGLVPIVVPRRRALGEVVDDHQLAFSSRLGRLGEVRVATTAQELHRLLDDAVAHPSRYRSALPPSGPTPAVDAFAGIVDRLIAPPERIRVLFIGGSGRSGTTLLDRMLGEIPELRSFGEVFHLWRRGLVQDTLCGCGLPFSDCGFWQNVGMAGFGGWGRVDARHIVDLQRSVERHRYIPLMLAPHLTRGYRERLEEFEGVLGSLYRAIHDVAGGRIVVDSSKHASYAFILRRLPGVELRVIHMVRDPRGVAYSWSKKVRRPEVTDREAFMPRHDPAEFGALWWGQNVVYDLLRSTGTPTLRVQYERLADQPRAEIERILRFAGERVDAGTLDFIGDGFAELGATHSVSGNPMRFDTGRVPLRLDAEWKEKMPPRDRTIVSAITAPLLARYGYPVKVR